MEDFKFDRHSIGRLKPRVKRYEVRDHLVKGLGIEVKPSGTKTYFFRYRLAGRNRRYIIGHFEDFRVKEARDEARSIRGKVSVGNDPQAERMKSRRVRTLVSFKELADEFKEIHLKPLRKKTVAEHSRIIDNELIPAFGRLAVKEVSKAEIISLLDKKAIKGGKPTMANRIRTRLHSIYEFAVHRGIVDGNPVASVRPYKEGETKRERYYSEEEIRKLWAEFCKLPEPMQSVFKILLLTGQRSGETRKMRWADLKGDIWTIPAELSKSNRAHDVPLSGQAMQIIDTLRPLTGHSEYVFESPRIPDQPVEWLRKAVNKVRDGSKAADLKRDPDIKYPGVPDFRLHDLRRTAATYMAKLNVDRTVLGKILNHKGLAGDGQVTAIYDRHSYLQEKRQALERWADNLEQILTGAETKIYKLR